MIRVEVPRAALAAIAAAATDAYPRECCGLLVGRRDGEVLAVARAVAAANVAADPARAFEVETRALLAAHRAAREDGLEVLGPYHSHPGGPAAPSATDAARAVAAGEAWLIVPVTEAGAGAPRAFVFDGRGFAEAALATI